jgi:predicted nucleotidyltransferase
MSSMRLTEDQHTTIVRSLRRYFGKSARIWLFGSRVNDEARGGDIDLLVEPDAENPDFLVDAKLKSLVELNAALGEQKIDIVIHRKNGPELPIHRIARETGVLL